MPPPPLKRLRRYYREPVWTCVDVWCRASGQGEVSGEEAGEGERGKELKTVLQTHGPHHTPLKMSASTTLCLFAMFHPLTHLSNKHSLTSARKHVTFLTGCHGAAAWLPLSRNVCMSVAANGRRRVSVVTGNTLSESSNNIAAATKPGR